MKFTVQYKDQFIAFKLTKDKSRDDLLREVRKAFKISDLSPSTWEELTGSKKLGRGDLVDRLITLSETGVFYKITPSASSELKKRPGAGRALAPPRQAPPRAPSIAPTIASIKSFDSPEILKSELVSQLAEKKLNEKSIKSLIKSCIKAGQLDLSACGLDTATLTNLIKFLPGTLRAIDVSGNYLSDNDMQLLTTAGKFQVSNNSFEEVEDIKPLQLKYNPTPPPPSSSSSSSLIASTSSRSRQATQQRDGKGYATNFNLPVVLPPSPPLPKKDEKKNNPLATSSVASPSLFPVRLEITKDGKGRLNYNFQFVNAKAAQAMLGNLETRTERLKCMPSRVRKEFVMQTDNRLIFPGYNAVLEDFFTLFKYADSRSYTTADHFLYHAYAEPSWFDKMLGTNNKNYLEHVFNNILLRAEKQPVYDPNSETPFTMKTREAKDIASPGRALCSGVPSGSSSPDRFFSTPLIPVRVMTDDDEESCADLGLGRGKD